ncbi:MAG: hypothetical protein GY928_18690, partial [Colwellia sp.]|nr:hypothetical protein [Colwellia sp.]
MSESADFLNNHEDGYSSHKLHEMISLPKIKLQSLMGEFAEHYHKERLNSVSEEDAKEPIQDALYSTGKFTTDQCDVLVDGILT